jgi:ferredoxin
MPGPYPPNNNSCESAAFLAYTNGVRFSKLKAKSYEVSTPDGQVKALFKTVSAAKEAMRSDPRFRGFQQRPAKSPAIEPRQADKNKKLKDNVTGSFYVDTSCVDCDLCWQMAPDFFARNEVGGYAYVKKQPAKPSETDRCRSALDACPTSSIGEDGA